MSIRDKFFKAMRRESENFVPFEFSLCPSLYEKFVRKTGEKDYVDYFKFPVRSITPEFLGNSERFAKYHKQAGEDGFGIDSEWGMGHKAGSVAHFTQMISPLTNAGSITEIMEYPLPDPNKDYDWAPIEEKVRQIKNNDLIAVAPMEFTIFEISWYIRGMEQFMMDLLTEPELAEALLDRICAIRCETAYRYAMAGCDVLRLGDDVSTQLDMMISPAQYRHFIKPRLKKVIETAKSIKPDIIIFYHGDGNLQSIIPDLIEVGVEILNPVQPECMDPIEIKKLYGDKLSFWGTLGTQTTMPFGTAEEVRAVCKEMIEKVGRGGGLFLAPTHLLEPEVPFENIEAFIGVVTEYNKSLK